MKIQEGQQENWEKCKANNSGDPYSARCVSYAVDWANLMEKQLDAGKTVVECAEATSIAADTDGITGFMYGAAVSMLSKFWQHGEALRRWHNKETQIGTEGDRANETGGVLNQAMLTIG